MYFLFFPKKIITLLNFLKFFSARSKDDNNKAAAPSFIPDEFPAVTLPLSWNTVFNFSKSEIFKLILGCSSLSKIFPS